MDCLSYVELLTPHTALLFPIVVLLLVLLLYVCRWRDYSLPRRLAAISLSGKGNTEKTDESAAVASPRVSIVVPAYNEAESLRRLLPLLLEQRYSGWYEVIVADQCSEDNTRELLLQLRQRYGEKLRTTFIPPTSRYVEHRKLALTLGIKAARGEWCIVNEADALPINADWLAHYTEALTPEREFVQSYGNYTYNGTMAMRRAVLARYVAWTSLLRAHCGGRVLGCGTTGWAVRREWFLEKGGFADSVNLPFGEERIFAVHHASAERTAFLSIPSTQWKQQPASSASLRTGRMIFEEVKRHCGAAVHRRALMAAFASWLVYLLTLLYVFYVAVRAVQILLSETYDTLYIYADAAMVVLWAVAMILPVWLLRRGLRAVNERRYGAYLYVYSLLHPWYTWAAKVARRTHKDGFVRSI